MRLIDADALLEDVRKNSVSYFAEDFAHEWVDKQPTIESVADCISRQAAVYALDTVGYDFTESGLSETELIEVCEAVGDVRQDMISRIKNLPSVQPKPAIPLQWIEAQIEWLKNLDNAFSSLTAGQISAMVNKWKDEQDG